MASTRSTLKGVDANLAESMGQRTGVVETPLAPVARPQDAGRRPLPEFGRIEIDRVAPDPDQPRTQFDEASIDRLAASLRDAGQLAPIRVRWSDSTGRWLIVAGERRWRAAQRAGLKTIECFFYQRQLPEGEVLQLQMIENLLREDLKPMEEARAFERLIQLHGWTGKQLAAALSVAESKVSRALALLRLPEDVQAQVDAGELAPRTAYELSRIDDQERQRRLARQAAAERLTHEQVAGKVRPRRAGRARKPRGAQVKLSVDDGWQVVVSRKTNGNYHDVEQALELALQEVRQRIRGRVQLL